MLSSIRFLTPPLFFVRSDLSDPYLNWADWAFANMTSDPYLIFCPKQFVRPLPYMAIVNMIFDPFLIFCPKRIARPLPYFDPPHPDFLPP